MSAIKAFIDTVAAVSNAPGTEVTPPCVAHQRSRINYSGKKARSCNNGWSILMSIRRGTHMLNMAL